MDVFFVVIVVVVVVSVLCWVLLLIMWDILWVDWVWLIVLVVYVWIFVVGVFVDDWGLVWVVLMGVLVMVWGVWLMFNFVCKGGYIGMEDYWWVILCQWMCFWQFQVFNVLFIVCYQMMLFVFIILFVFVVVEYLFVFMVGDVVFIVVFFVFFVGEIVVDQQQWNFYQCKKQVGGILVFGFVMDGFFCYSCYLNFFFEQVQWWVFYVIGVIVVVVLGVGVIGGVFNLMIVGVVLFIVLFIGLMIFIELIIVLKYFVYVEYWCIMLMFILWLLCFWVVVLQF